MCLFLELEPTAPKALLKEKHNLYISKPLNKNGHQTYYC